MAAYKISIIIPAYNEKNTIRAVIKRLINADFGIDKEIIVVNDGSTDGTQDILKEITEKEVIVAHHKVNLGKGAAIRTALKHISGDIIIIQDADLEYPPEQCKDLIRPILDGQADVIYGSRFLGIHRVFMVWHYFGNKLVTFLANILYNTTLTDVEVGYKIFTRQALEGIIIRSNRFDFETEFTAKIFKKRLRVVEAPIIYYGRGYSEGKKITWKDAFPAIWALIKYRFVD
ncbi:MAG: glycosyltransferase family 2 protein [Candidatus Omnitrophica bacterium]|nr:glycosyltransferase family 2 protein [Candidatus Omnitrophota bacterium]